MVKFKFQDLKVWELAIEIVGELFNIADTLEKKRRNLISEEQLNRLLDQLNHLCRQIANFQISLKNRYALFPLHYAKKEFFKC